MSPTSALAVTILLSTFAVAAQAQVPHCLPPNVSAGEFTIVLVPDTQYYSKTWKEDAAPAGIYEEQMEWIAANRNTYNIQYVVHLGDVTHRYGETSNDEWKLSRDAHRKLDEARIPYSVVPGNHDHKRRDGNSDNLVRGSLQQFNRYFGPINELGYDNGWQYRGGKDGYANNYSTFETAGKKFLMLGLEFVPTKDTVCWASDVVRRHPDHWTIVSTHCYLDKSGYDYECDSGYGLTGANGANLYNELISRHPNVALVVNGHVHGVARHCRSRACWNPVHEILTDFQYEALTRGMTTWEKHGAGWMRLLKIKPGQAGLESCVLTSVPGVTTFNHHREGSVITGFTNLYGQHPTDSTHRYTLPYFDISKAPPAVPPVPIQFFSDRAVNAVSTGEQMAVSVATNPAGDWVAVWADSPTDSAGRFRVKARLFQPDGCQKVQEFMVSPHATIGRELHPLALAAINAVAIASRTSVSTYVAAFGRTSRPAVGMNQDRFAVAWLQDKDGDGKGTIELRVFALDGRLLWEKTASGTNDVQRGGVRLAVDPSGRVTVVWHEEGTQVNGAFQVYGRGFDAVGASRFGPLALNAQAAGDQRAPTIAAAIDGDFVVAWQDDQNANGLYQIKARGFGPTGAQRFAQFTVNTSASGQQLLPSIAMDGQKRFVVVWQDDGNSNRIYEIKKRGFTSSGLPRISESTVNATSQGQQLDPQIGMAPTGEFVVVWADDRNNNGTFNVRARRFGAEGNAVAGDELVNRATRGQQTAPAVAMGGLTHVIAWRDDVELNNRGEILAAGCLNAKGCEREGRTRENHQTILESIKATCPAGGWPICSLNDLNVLPNLNFFSPTPAQLRSIPR